MNVDVRTNAPQVARAMRENARQAAFALSRAINETAKDFQQAQREHQRSAFTVRRPAFVDNAVKIKPFATKSSLTARISIDPPGGRARADILTQHEHGGIKRPRGKSIAIPKEVGTNKAGIVTKGQRPRVLDFKQHGSGNVMKGAKRTIL
ncbi:MAG TPA: hypothetical protein VNP72_09615, partial [Longimicrobium sp.]|nr:hypothetical protein [Longimicrobium sp.]